VQRFTAALSNLRGPGNTQSVVVPPHNNVTLYKPQTEPERNVIRLPPKSNVFVRGSRDTCPPNFVKVDRDSSSTKFQRELDPPAGEGALNIYGRVEKLRSRQKSPIISETVQDSLLTTPKRFDLDRPNLVH